LFESVMGTSEKALIDILPPKLLTGPTTCTYMPSLRIEVEEEKCNAEMGEVAVVRCVHVHI